MLRVNLKRYDGNPLYLTVHGDRAFDMPFVYENPFKKQKYVELPPVPLSIEKVQQWADKNGERVQVSPSAEGLNAAHNGRVTPVDYELFNKLYPHQQFAVQYAAAHTPVRLCIGDDPRLGKSPQALAIASELNLKTVLLLCPKALRHQWVQYITDWYTKPANVVVLDGPTEVRRAQLEEARSGSTDNTLFVVCNWETLYWVPEITQQKWSLVIGDEAHKLKNRKSKISNMMRMLGKNATHMLLLSATFVQDMPDDWFSPLQILLPEKFTSYWRFLGMFTDLGYNYAASSYEPKQPRNSDLLKQYIGPHVIQRRSDEVADMPEKIYEDYYCPLSKWHKRLYDELHDSVVVELQDGNVISMPNVISKITRLRQMAIHPGMIDPARWHEDAQTGKLATLAALVHETIPHNEQVIVYSSFVNGCKAGKWAIETYGEHAPNWCEIYAGDDADDDTITQFVRRQVRVLLATPQKGGVGLNLFNANYVIYLDLPWSSVHIRQSEERVRAIGKSGPVYIIRLLAEDTIDAHVYRTIRSKLDNVADSEILRTARGLLK